MDKTEIVLVSDYVGQLRNGKYINADRLIAAIDANSTSQKDALFAKVFPVPNYFTVELNDGEFTIKKHETRTIASGYRDKNKATKSYRDYFILDTAAFEQFLDDNVDDVSYLRTPKGMDSGKKIGSKFYTPEFLASLSPEQAAQIAAEMAQTRLTGKKRELTPEHKAKLVKAAEKARAARGK